MATYNDRNPKQHKWHKEIKAWADGAEIEVRWFENKFSDRWYKAENPDWNTIDSEYRIKPQPKEPQYLHVYAWDNEIEFCREVFSTVNGLPYIGKIKLEVDDD